MFPFKEEDIDVVASNLSTASRHERVDEVWAVAADETQPWPRSPLWRATSHNCPAHQ